jgi:hypothetical protein
MPVTRQHVFVLLAVCAGIAAGIDTAIGLVIFAFGGLTGGGYERALFVSFLLGFPAYAADIWWRRQRVCICMASLFLFRWVWGAFLAGGFDDPISWPMGIVLFVALMLMQTAKLLKPHR